LKAIESVGPWDFHDSEILQAHLDWDTGAAELTIAVWSPGAQDTRIKLLATGTILFHWPRRQPWGESTQIRRIDGPTRLPEGQLRLAIEMQSGDVIVIEAAQFELPGDT
jgi:hypothetical protein